MSLVACKTQLAGSNPVLQSMAETCKVVLIFEGWSDVGTVGDDVFASTASILTILSFILCFDPFLCK